MVYSGPWEDLLYSRGLETWDEYRRRIERTVFGIGKAKASFACCLLYPLEADLACLDTWMLKHFHLPPEKNGRLTWEEYHEVENKVREYALAWGVSTFVAQWIVWDHERGSIESHAVVSMPGGHK